MAPVVSVIVLVLIVMVAGGGTYVWITSVVAEEQAGADRALNTELRMRDVVCDRGAVKIGVSNTGSQGINTASADLFVYDVSDGDLVASRDDVDLSDLSLDPGDFTTIPLFTRNILTTGGTHRVELRFPDDDTTVTDTCTVRAGSLAAGIWPFDRTTGMEVFDVAGGDDGVMNFFVDDWEIYANGTEPAGWSVTSVGGCTGNCTFDIYTTTENQAEGDTSFRFYLDPKGGPGGWTSHPLASKPLSHNLSITPDLRLHWKQYDRDHSLHVCLKVRNNASQTRRLCYLANADNHWGVLCSGDEDVNMTDASGTVTHDCTDCYDAWHEYERKIYADYEDTYCDATVPVNVTAVEFEHFMRDDWSGNHGSDIDDLWINDREPRLDGAAGRALGFDGIDDQVTVAGSTGLNISGAFTASAWTYVDLSQTATDHQSDWPILVSGQHGYEIRRRPDSNQTEGFFDFVGSGKHWLYHTFSDDGWYHILQSYNGTHATLYVDGDRQDSQFIGSDSLAYRSKDTTIGGPTNLNGTIDEVQIYPTALR